MMSKARTIPCVPFLHSTGTRGFASTATTMKWASLLPAGYGAIGFDESGYLSSPPPERGRSASAASREGVSLLNYYALSRITSLIDPHPNPPPFRGRESRPPATALPEARQGETANRAIQDTHSS